MNAGTSSIRPMGEMAAVGLPHTARPTQLLGVGVGLCEGSVSTVTADTSSLAQALGPGFNEERFTKERSNNVVGKVCSYLIYFHDSCFF